jgi:hypothetical protein
LLTTDGLGALSWYTPVTPDLQAVTTAGAVTTDTVDVGGLIASGLTYPAADGAAGELLTTDGAGNLGWVAAGSNLQQVTTVGAVTTDRITSGGLTATDTILAVDGTVAAPSIAFASATGTGLSVNATGDLFVSRGGVDYAQFDPTQIIVTADTEVRANINLPFATGQVRFVESSGTSATIFKAAATIPADVTFTVPSVDGANGDVLSTDGAGDLSWITTAQIVATPPSSGAGGADNQISFDAAGNFYFYKGGQWWKVAGVAF